MHASVSHSHKVVSHCTGVFIAPSYTFICSAAQFSSIIKRILELALTFGTSSVNVFLDIPLFVSYLALIIVDKKTKLRKLLLKRLPANIKCRACYKSSTAHLDINKCQVYMDDRRKCQTHYRVQYGSKQAGHREKDSQEIREIEAKLLEKTQKKLLTHDSQAQFLTSARSHFSTYSLLSCL